MRQALDYAAGLLERRQQLVLSTVIVVILAMGLLYSVYLGDALRYPDEKEYVSIAANLADKGIYSMDGIHPTAFRTPGYPLPLAALHLIGGGVFAYRLFNFVSLAFSVWFAGREFSQRISPLAGSIIPLMFLAYPVLVYQAGTLYPQTLQLTLILVLLLHGTRRHLTRMDFVILGALIAWTVLTVPTTIFVIIVLAVYWLRVGVKRSSILIAALAAAVILGVWTARSTIAMGQLVLLSTNFGRNFLIGNSPNARPNSGPTIDISDADKQASGLTEIAKDTVYRQAAFKWIREKPADAAELYLLKVLNYFNYRNDLATKSEASAANDIVMFLTYYPILLLACARLVMSKKWPLSPAEAISTVVYFGNAFVGALVFNRIRYRLPYDVLLFFLVVGFLVILLKELPAASSKTMLDEV